ncbi:RsmB/NOP family class I SAM-dependent RNA methyltransferase [Paracoccus sp. 1_MG-2023]|uniref:RsmB/NOP family class I SAM-dependent RNA methyltransferase n=1 Tax=unclassified Paracoccus (in: a-proteobacteria) TaxID=2688777 RepID=UPI001C0919BD|nr:MULTISPECIES: RsmB/NOP family class I SAM-dependent RNA methyltransferase [unclassified Paracoccus (in: a-proteobacteria)]MBU2956657.1 RsmB/NOP family class I SAM-dependent RNA methyltransferase [Paracoccus sp. C2R09]MDO6668763.1 RsmB/NOP family class I SAM-dependent RNA methyltransferase [Paracoccus sp. 1_MG-2023]
MTPAARIAAAADILDRILDGTPAEAALLRWSRASRFAGSGDRAALRDLVFGALRRRDSLAALGGALTGRGLMIGHLRAEGLDPATVFTGQAHAPAPLSDAELSHEAPATLPDDLPDWLRPAWTNALGDDAAQIARAMTERAPVWLRVNPVRATPDQAIDALAEAGIEVARTELLATALRITANERKLAQSRAYKDGLVELQDLSPQIACALLPLNSGDKVLDFCAGGGGKSLALAAREPGAQLMAHDASAARLSDLPARAARAGASIRVVDDPRDKVDLVVADVPCSGSGTWRRGPDAKWRLTADDLQGLVETQARILDRVAGLVAPGGHLAYMTCSVLGAENDDQVAGFLQRHPQFTVVMRRLMTPLDAGDGFFLALMKCV